MKKLLVAVGFLISSVVLVNCTVQKAPEVQVPVKDRKVTASDSEENLRQTFQSLITSDDPENRFIAYLERHNNLFFAAQEYLKVFDTKLTEADDALKAGKDWDDVQALSPMRDPNYKKLLASRMLLERFRDKISYIYVELLKLANYKSEGDRATPEERAEKQRLDKIATRVLSRYNKHLNSLKKSTNVDRVAVQALLDNSIEAIRSFNAERRRLRAAAVDGRISDGVPEMGLATTTTPQMFSSNEALVQFVKRYKSDISKISENQAAKMSDEDKAEIDLTIPAIDFVVEERAPQQALPIVFKPDNGPLGNMTGNTFPAGVWAITFDDGPSNKYTPNVLATAMTYQVPLTFFWLAANMTAYPEAVKSVYKAHMAIESHSYTHQNMPKMTEEKLDYEITEAINYTNRTLDGMNGDIAADPALKQSMQFFRLPYGAGLRELRIRQRISSKNLVHVFWNVDSLDWQDKNPDSIVERVAKQMRIQKHGIILFHDVHPQSAAAFAILAKKIKEKPVELSGGPIRLINIPGIADEMNGIKK